MRTIIIAIAALCSGVASVIAEEGETSMDDRGILKTIDAMTNAFAKGDIDGVMATYEAGAVVVGFPGTPVAGDMALRSMFADFVASGVAFTYGRHEVVISGDVGLHLMKWTAPGPESAQSALSVAVLRRQVDGSWKMLIDHPFGDGVMTNAK